jgi:formate dehydrogenase major subunit
LGGSIKYKIYIDEEEVETTGKNLLEGLINSGKEIPYICYHPKLGVIRTCDLCLVEVDGKVVRSCEIPLKENLRVSTHSQLVQKLRRRALEEILRNHELYCSLCENNNGDCLLHNLTKKMKIERQEFVPKPYEFDDSNPFYVYDPRQCILCGRCVEACQDVVVNEVIRIDWDMSPPRVVWDSGKKINESSCVSCGTCVTVCPVNALMEKTMLGEIGVFTGIGREKREKIVSLAKKFNPNIPLMMLLSDLESSIRMAGIKRTKTVCPYCGVGCSFEVWTKGRKILKVEPKPESPANGIASCVKGKFGWDFVNSHERLKRPLIKKGGEFKVVSWEEAMELISRKLKGIIDKYGSDSIGIIATCTGSNEEAYLAQKLARQVIGTNNIDNCARYCQAPATTGLFRTVGIGADSGDMESITKADLVIIIGSNTTEAHPVLAGKIKREHKLRGQKLVVIDVRSHEMAELADLFISPHPGTDLFLINAIAKYILDNNWENRDFIEKRTVNFGEYRESLRDYTLESAEKITGVPSEQIIQLAKMIYEANNVSILFGMGVTQHEMGSETATAISNLLLLTGNYGREGTGAYPLRGHANVQGVSDFGALPQYLPGYESVDDPEVRKKYEIAWNCKLPEKKGLTSTEMIDAILEGKIKALIVMGEDKVLADSNQTKVMKALERLELLIVIELFLTRTAKLAHVVLPAASVLEKEGTFVNTERRIQRFYKAFEPIGDAKADWEIIQMIARSLGANWSYKNPSEIMEEVSRLCDSFKGVKYERLEGFKSLLWPVKESGEDTRILYTEKFNFPDGKARFYATKWVKPPSLSKTYDLYLDNGRILEHFHWGNLTKRSKGLTDKFPEVIIEIPQEVARIKGINNGDLVIVKSRYGRAYARAIISERVSGQRVFMSIQGQGGDAVNLVTGDERDNYTKTPAYKEIPVMIEKIEGESKNPLPFINYRHYLKERVKQTGVKVEKKWERIGKLI